MVYLLLLVTALMTAQEPSRPSFVEFLAGIRTEALARGIRPDVIDQALTGIEEPSATVIERIVDFAVPHSADEALRGRGFEVSELEAQFAGMWRLHWFKSYNYTGFVQTRHVPRRLRREADELATLYPNDGANMCSIWTRC